jgi:hypothetical protein
VQHLWKVGQGEEQQGLQQAEVVRLGQLGKAKVQVLLLAPSTLLAAS